LFTVFYKPDKQSERHAAAIRFSFEISEEMQGLIVTLDSLLVLNVDTYSLVYLVKVY
jgi:hypothetical protein